ncbi:MAG: TonB-dependent siderophore receptor [Haliea sp.]|nr:MAG: TonB-dependent siderophore receptor [Haliea sp.]
MFSRKMQAAKPVGAGLRATQLSSALRLAFAAAVVAAPGGLLLAQTSGTTATPPAASADGTTLAPITVSGERGAAGTTEGSGSYTTDSMSSATRLNLTVRETPQSISVITRQQLDDQNIQSLEDITAIGTGLTLSKGATERASLFSRGFSINNFTQDGMTISGSADTLGFSTLSMYDRVEVIRGPAGLLTGAGNPGGSINLVRKRPTRDTQVSVTGTVGRYNNFRTELDASGSLNEAKTLRGRFVAAAQDSDTFIQNYENKRGLVYATVEADLGPRTLLSAGFHYNKEDNPGSMWYGLPTSSTGAFLPGLDRSSTIAPAWAYWDKTNSRVFAELEHTFQNDWKIKLSAHQLHDTLDSLVNEVARVAPAAQNRFNVAAASAFLYDRDQQALEAQVSGPFELWGRKHEVVFGANRRTLDQVDIGNTTQTPYNFLFTPVSWNPSAPPQPVISRFFYGQTTRTQQNGIYGTARFKVADPLAVIVGARMDSFDYFAVNTFTGVTSSRYAVKNEVTPYVGAVYDLNDTYSIYGSWTSVFNPQTAVDRAGVLLDPVTGVNKEIGIKGEYFGGALNVSAAVFDLRQQNLATTLPVAQCRPGLLSCSEAAGEVQSRGFELEAAGALTPSWQVSAGYTFNSAKYTQAQGANAVGTRFATDRPTQLLRVSTNYRLPGDLGKWRVGASVRSQNEMFRTANTIKQGGYTIFDLMAGYKVSEKLDIRFNMTNVFDKNYYQAIGGSTDSASAFGEPRNFSITAKYKF